MTAWQATANWQTLEKRSAFFAAVRGYFQQRDCLEVQVPILQSGANLDHGIDIFQCSDAQYLISSPEHYLKRLLCAGAPSCYAISPCFRRHESGKKHNPEFYLLEWYRLGWNERQLAEEVCHFINQLLLSNSDIHYISYREVFLAACHCDPFSADTETLSALLPNAPETTRAEILDLIMLDIIEPSFDPDGITVLHSYPANQAAQARRSVDEHGNPFAHRFEIYHRGMELANGYWECTDATDIRQRMCSDNPADLQLDEAYLSALERGLPDCAGVALGLDRLFMIQQGSDDIKDVIAFPHQRS